MYKVKNKQYKGDLKMIIYHTETLEDYDALTTELEEQGYYWASYQKPTSKKHWYVYEENTCIISDNHNYIYYAKLEMSKKTYPDTPIIEYKAKKETNDFIKELTVKIYYNEITKKHYNSYEDAIADCKKEMERQHDKN